MRIGLKEVAGVFIGTKRVDKIYIGEKLAYSSGSIGLSYSYSGGAYTVTGVGEFTGDNLVIPESYNDGINGTRLVTQIGDNAFKDCAYLKSVKIPNSIINIGEYAFYGCSGLETITIPKNVESIGVYAFGWCSGLNKIIYNARNVAERTGDRMHAGFSVAMSGSGILQIGKEVETIPSGLFSYCYGDTIIFENGSSCKNISDGAFYGCKYLRTVKAIPLSVTSIGQYAFDILDLKEIANLDIYCEAERKPDGWHSEWCYDPDSQCTATVVWKYKEQ